MSATSTTGRLPERPTHSGREGRATVRQRAVAIVTAAAAAVLGVLPHVLHHAGPFAGAALFAGAGGTVVLGAVGLLAAIPFLLRVHRRSGTWALPGALLTAFAVVFSISAFVIAPAITSESSSPTRSIIPAQSAPPPTPDSYTAHHQ